MGWKSELHTPGSTFTRTTLAPFAWVRTVERFGVSVTPIGSSSDSSSSLSSSSDGGSTAIMCSTLAWMLGIMRVNRRRLAGGMCSRSRSQGTIEKKRRSVADPEKPWRRSVMSSRSSVKQFRWAIIKREKERTKRLVKSSSASLKSGVSGSDRPTSRSLAQMRWSRGSHFC